MQHLIVTADCLYFHSSFHHQTTMQNQYWMQHLNYINRICFIWSLSLSSLNLILSILNTQYLPWQMPHKITQKFMGKWFLEKIQTMFFNYFFIMFMNNAPTIFFVVADQLNHCHVLFNCCIGLNWFLIWIWTHFNYRMIVFHESTKIYMSKKLRCLIDWNLRVLQWQITVLRLSEQCLECVYVSIHW